MSHSTIVAIIEKYSTGALSPEEAVMLHDWLENVSPEVFHQTLDECAVLPAGLKEYPALSPAFRQSMETVLNMSDEEENGDVNAEEKREDDEGNDMYGHDEALTVRMYPWRKWAAVAASIIVLLSAGAWYWLAHKAGADMRGTELLAIKKNDVAPGLNGAILTLADGKQIVLDSTNSGFSANEGDARVTKSSNDQLTYQEAHAVSGRSIAIIYNTLTTPRGRKINVVLADGTKVWLNAASSIKYPTVFSGKDRVVEITGEAYFEVAENARLPFIVKKMGSDYNVLVLGTHFNVNAYDDEEAITTTLLEGLVRTDNGGISRTLKPGQQAIVRKDHAGVEILTDANIGGVMAWKNGNFSFDRVDINAVMRQIARWYDVDVEYKGTITRHFGGTISRDVNVSQVLKMLELTGAVRFGIEGRKIIVMP
jgi:transmembrane sensor